MIIISDYQRRIIEAMACYGRNFRWGTCGGCPRDARDAPYPEFCADTARYDHRLTGKALALQIAREHAERAPGEDDYEHNPTLNQTSFDPSED